MIPKGVSSKRRESEFSTNVPKFLYRRTLLIGIMYIPWVYLSKFYGSYVAWVVDYPRELLKFGIVVSDRESHSHSINEMIEKKAPTKVK